MLLASLWPAHNPYLPALLSAAKKLIAPVRLEPRDESTVRHFKLFKNLTRLGIDATHFTLFTLRGGMPELSVDPRDPGYETVGLDRAQYPAGVRIDLMDLPVAILPYPERSFRPSKPGVMTAAGRRDGGEHLSVS